MESDAKEGLAGRPGSGDGRVDFLRGFICATATHWLQHGDSVSTRDLLRAGGTTDDIMAEADPVDIDTLQQAGLLPIPESPNAPALPRREKGENET